LKGSLDYLEIDAETFADWTVDYVKLDGCYADVHQMDDGYPQMSEFLNKTGRPVCFQGYKAYVNPVFLIHFFLTDGVFMQLASVSSV
jgi:hypothetical protein